MTTLIKPTEEHARAVLEIIGHGLCKGVGVQERGKMCVEAAVCFAFGLPHGDNPPCVAPSVRAFKIALNDSGWSSDNARAVGLRRLAIAQLGSNEIDEAVFIKELALAIIRKIVPLALRAAAGMKGCVSEHKPKLELCALNCETTTDLAASYAARAASYAASYASDAASDAASYAARAASYAASAASAASDASDAASDAARAARAASYAASYAAKDTVFSMAAECAVQALIKSGCPGCQWLHLTEL